MLLWVDLETTGLSPTSDVILELAAIVTDDKLVETARFHRVTNGARTKYLHLLHPTVQDMHHKNGLWMESLRCGLPVNQPSTTMAAENLDRDFEAFISINAVALADGKPVLPQLAGSTIGFDRAFMEAHLPQSARLFHYRSLDVTSLNELARRVAPALHDGRPKHGGTAHRAMADIESSLEVARYYAQHLTHSQPRECDLIALMPIALMPIAEHLP